MDFLIWNGERIELSRDISWHMISFWEPASPFPSMSKSSVIVSATMVEMFSSIETVAMDIVAPDMIAPIWRPI